MIPFIFITVFLVYILVECSRKHKNFPPGPAKLPLWGSYWFLLKENYRHVHLGAEKLAKKYGTDIVGLYLGETPTIVPISYELVYEALKKEEFNGRNNTVITRMRGLGGPRGIFFLDGPHWKHQRRFALRQLRDFGFGRRSDHVESFIEQEIRSLIEIVSENPKLENKDINPEKGVFLIPDLFFGLLYNAILQLLASNRYDDYEMRQLARSALRFQRSGDQTGGALSMTPWLKEIAPKVFGYTDAFEGNQKLLDFFQIVIEEHRRTYVEGHLRDLIDVYISKQNELENDPELAGFSDTQMLLVMVDFFFPAAIAGGFTMQFYFANIINNKDVQRKVQEEIDRVVGRSRLPNLNDRPDMPYTEATIRESMRFSPINPMGIARRCMEDTTFYGYDIPKDTILLPCVWTAHRDPKVWKHPHSFNVENFLDENGKLMKKDPLLGFGLGKRLCAGETFARHLMFQVISGFLQNFNVDSPDGKDICLDEGSIIPGGNLSLDDFFVKLIPR